MAKRRRKSRSKEGKPVDTGRPPVVVRRSTRVWYVVGALAIVVAAVVVIVASRADRNEHPSTLTSGSASGSGFNVLLVTLDTTRADRLACYGHGRADTPVLDSLAANGVRFHDAITPVPTTLPSHTTILTGLYPPSHGVRANGEYRLAEDYTTLGEVLGENGYQTAAFISAFVLDARYGLDQGFDVYNEWFDERATDDPLAGSIPERRAGSVSDSAIRWLAARDRTRPFFCWVHYFDPHRPWNPPPPYSSRFRDDLYDGEIAYMDSQLGRVVEALKKDGVWDSTLIVVVGDHGEGLGDHGEDSHGILIYDSVMRVPFIMSCPGLSWAPVVVDDSVVSTVDVFPTVLDLLAIDGDHPCDGKSLVNLQGHPDRYVYIENLGSYLDHGWAPLFGLRRYADKYIRAPQQEYYDLRNDPGELNNLFGKVSGEALAARDYLDVHLSKRLSDWPSFESAVGLAQQPDPEARRMLESLGYVGTTSGDGKEENLSDPKVMIPTLQSLNQVTALHIAGRSEEALALIRKSQDSAERDFNLTWTLGKVLLAMGREEEASEALQKAIEIRPQPKVCLLLAQIRIKNRDFAEAARLLDQVLDLDPLQGGAYIARGDMLALRGRPREAMANYARAKEVDPYRITAVVDARMARIRELLQKTGRP